MIQKGKEVAIKASRKGDEWYCAKDESESDWQKYQGGLMTGYVCSRCREALFSAGKGVFLECPKCGGRPVGFSESVKPSYKIYKCGGCGATKGITDVFCPRCGSLKRVIAPVNA